MAQVNIFEMSKVSEIMPIRKTPFNAQQALTASPSAAFAKGTSMITVQSDTAIYVKISLAGTAATTLTDYKVAAGVNEDFYVEPGQILAWTT
jgi:hypothetical protein